MSLIIETRRAEGHKRASGNVLAGNILEHTRPLGESQCAWVRSRYEVSAAVANLISEHAFQKGASR